MASVPRTKPAPSAASCHVNSCRCGGDASGTGVCAGSRPASVAARPRMTMVELEFDLTRTLEIGEKHRLGLHAERGVFDDGVELVVDRDAERIEVGRSDADPAAV